MAKVAVKAGMRTSAPGSKSRLARGFTLLELMVVVAMIGVASAVVLPVVQKLKKHVPAPSWAGSRR